MSALPNTGGALCSAPQSLATTRVPCSNAVKTRNPLKFAVVPQTRQRISAASRPKFTILRRQVGEILLFNQFFRLSNICLRLRKYSPIKLCDGAQMANFWRFFGSCISSEPHAARFTVSDLHPKFALRPHHVWKCGRHPICDG